MYKTKHCMLKLFARLKSKKPLTLNDEQNITEKLEVPKHEKLKIVEPDIKQRRHLSVVSPRVRTNSISRKESIVERACQMNEIEISNLNKGSKRKVRSLNTNSLKYEDLSLMQETINEMDRILHPQNASKEEPTSSNEEYADLSQENEIEFENVVEPNDGIVSSDIVEECTAKSEPEETKDATVTTTVEDNQKLLKREEELRIRLEEERKRELEFQSKLEEIKKKQEEEAREEQQKARRLNDKLAKLKKIQEQIENEESARRKQEEENLLREKEEQLRILKEVEQAQLQKQRQEEEEKQRLEVEILKKQKEEEQRKREQIELQKQQEFQRRIKEEQELLRQKNEQELLEKERKMRELEEERELVRQGNIPMILAKLQQNDPTIKKIDLTDKKIGNINCIKIMEALKMNTTLGTLILRNNSLDNACVKSICEMLYSNTSLHTLDLDGNFITQTETVVEALEKNTCICNLEIGQFASEDLLDQIEDYLDRNYNLRQNKL